MAAAVAMVSVGDGVAVVSVPKYEGDFDDDEIEYDVLVYAVALDLSRKGGRGARSIEVQAHTTPRFMKDTRPCSALLTVLTASKTGDGRKSEGLSLCRDADVSVQWIT